MRFALKSCGGMFSFCLSLSLSIAPAAKAAEKLNLRVGPFEKSVTISEIEKFAIEGELSPRLQPLRVVLKPKLQQILSQSVSVDPKVASKFLDDLLDTEEGKKLIAQINTALPKTSKEELKTTLITAAQKNKDINAIAFLKAYPDEKITINLASAASLALKLNAYNLQSKVISPVLEKDLKLQISDYRVPNFDPTAKGKHKVRKHKIILRDKIRKRRIPVDIYHSHNSSGPLIVMSHGYAADRRFLRYLAIHLASYGLTVISLEHPGSNLKFLKKRSLTSQSNDLFSPSEFIDRPKDISFVLDRLEKIQRELFYWEGKFNVEQVVVIGHSFGGYTALALAGAELKPKALRQFCQQLSPLGRSPADWLQCAAAKLPYNEINLRDRRVVKIIAFNPVVDRLFGDSLRKINIPILVLASSNDGIAPIVKHQLRPFKQFRGEKYLIAAVGATHMSVTDLKPSKSSVGKNTLVKETIGSEAKPVRKLAKAVSLAFIYQQTSKAAHYQPFLTAAYVQSLSSSNISLRLTTQLPITMNAWIGLLHFGDRQINRQKSQSQKSPLYPIKQIFNARKNLPQPKYCTGKLNIIFTDILEQDYQHTTKIT